MQSYEIIRKKTLDLIVVVAVLAAVIGGVPVALHLLRQRAHVSVANRADVHTAPLPEFDAGELEVRIQVGGFGRIVVQILVHARTQ